MRNLGEVIEEVKRLSEENNIFPREKLDDIMFQAGNAFAEFVEQNHKNWEKLAKPELEKLGEDAYEFTKKRFLENQDLPTMQRLNYGIAFHYIFSEYYPTTPVVTFATIKAGYSPN
mgnify:CR=1 FL=1